MNTLCEVLEDRPNTFEEFKSGLASYGFNTRIARTTSKFASHINDVPANIAGWLVDNHIERCSTLKDFGRPDIVTNGGSDAGIKIISEIMIPRMREGILPVRPIGLMSALDLSRAESTFRARFGDEFSNVYFVYKPRSSDEAIDKIKTYLNALEAASNFDAEDSPANSRAVRTKMLIQSGSNLGLDSHDISRILRVDSKVRLEYMINREEILLDSSAWEEMAIILFEIDVALSNIFGEEADSSESIKHWVRSFKVDADGRTAKEMLLTGEYSAAYKVLYAAAFLLEG